MPLSMESLNSVVALISSAAPTTFFAALGAGVIGNIVAGYLFRKRLKEHHVELSDFVVKIEGAESLRRNVKLNAQEMKRIVLLLETIEAAEEQFSAATPQRPTDVVAKIGEYLTNKSPMDSLLKEVAK